MNDVTRTSKDLVNLLRGARDFVGKSRCSRGHSVDEVLDRSKPTHAGHCIYCAHQVKLHDDLMSEIARLGELSRRSAHEPCPECEKRKHANDRINFETTEDGFRICRGYHHRSADCEWEYYVRRPSQPPGEFHPDQERLNFIESECIELRCKESRNHDDADVYYEAVKFFMQKPHERPVGTGATPRAAIDEAMKNDDDQCCYCGGEGCTACTPLTKAGE